MNIYFSCYEQTVQSTEFCEPVSTPEGFSPLIFLTNTCEPDAGGEPIKRNEQVTPCTLPRATQMFVSLLQLRDANFCPSIHSSLSFTSM